MTTIGYNRARHLATALDSATGALRSCTEIGPAGAVARAAAGVTLVYLALLWNDPGWADPLFAFVVIPAAITGLLALRARRTQRPLRLFAPVDLVEARLRRPAR